MRSPPRLNSRRSVFSVWPENTNCMMPAFALSRVKQIPGANQGVMNAIGAGKEPAIGSTTGPARRTQITSVFRPATLAHCGNRADGGAYQIGESRACHGGPGRK